MKRCPYCDEPLVDRPRRQRQAPWWLPAAINLREKGHTGSCIDVALRLTSGYALRALKEFGPPGITARRPGEAYSCGGPCWPYPQLSEYRDGTRQWWLRGQVRLTTAEAKALTDETWAKVCAETGVDPKERRAV